MSKSNCIIEKEFVRQKLYNQLLNKVSGDLKKLKYKEINHFVLRYILILIINKDESDDPIFIVKDCKLTEDQVKGDFLYFHIENDPLEYHKKLRKYIEESLAQLKNWEKMDIKDEKVELNRNSIMYRGERLCEDVGGLAKKYPKYISHAAALNIRYTYMKLTTHGLARCYKNMGLKPEDGTEAFASPFNHYFNNYCSAFPDLESVYGSLGSFFSIKADQWKTTDIYINPPFDVNLIEEVTNKCYQHLEELKDYPEIQFDDEEVIPAIRFTFTLPNWNKPPFPALEKLKENSYKTRETVYKKGDLAFIDYMQNGKIIYPCEIVEIVLQT